MRGRTPDGLVGRAAGVEGSDRRVQGRDRTRPGPRRPVLERGHVDDLRLDTDTGRPRPRRGRRERRQLRQRHHLRRVRLDRHRTPAQATGSGAATAGSGATGGDSDTPEQIASDQAAIDSAEADLINAEQSLDEATLNSPISGTVVSVDIAAGGTVSADSSTDIITIIGTKSYEVEGTLDSSQVPSVKVGQSAAVQVDGTNGSVDGTVSQVGPVQSSDGEYSYPVVVDLPTSNGHALHRFDGQRRDRHRVGLQRGGRAHLGRRDRRHPLLRPGVRQGRADQEGRQGRDGG